jgi:hypothetical protein
MSLKLASHQQIHLVWSLLIEFHCWKGRVDLSSGIGSGSVGKEGGRIGLSINFTDISAPSRMRPHSYKSSDDCVVLQWAEPRLFVRKTRHRRRGDFDGRKLV